VCSLPLWVHLFLDAVHSLCEMLFWLKEEEMSHEELTQRLTTVITHVGKISLLFYSLRLRRFGGPVPPGGADALYRQKAFV